MKNKIKVVCSYCGSEDVLADAYAKWDVGSQEYKLSSTFDSHTCEKCDGECHTKNIPLTLFSEIRTDYIDDNGVVHLDGYKTADDNEEGTGIAYFINGEIYWRDPEFQFDPMVAETVAELVAEFNLINKINHKDMKKSTDHPVWEFTHKSFDGGTDKTDHLVKWVEAETKEIAAELVEKNFGEGYLFCQEINVVDGIDVAQVVNNNFYQLKEGEKFRILPTSIPDDLPEWIKKMDWSLLTAQKNRILESISRNECSANTVQALDGIVLLLDAIQDWATDDLGLGEKIVSPSLGEE